MNFTLPNIAHRQREEVVLHADEHVRHRHHPAQDGQGLAVLKEGIR